MYQDKDYSYLYKLGYKALINYWEIFDDSVSPWELSDSPETKIWLSHFGLDLGPG